MEQPHEPGSPASGPVGELTSLPGVDVAVLHESLERTVTLYVQIDRPDARIGMGQLAAASEVLHRCCTSTGRGERDAGLVVVGADADGGPVSRAPIARRLTLDIVAEVLGVANLKLEDNFVDLGGDSLTAIQVCTPLEDYLDISLSFDNLVTSPLIEDIVALVAEQARDGGVVGRVG